MNMHITARTAGRFNIGRVSQREQSIDVPINIFSERSFKDGRTSSAGWGVRREGKGR